MTQPLTPSDALAAKNANKRPIKAAHLDGSETLQEGRAAVLWEGQVPADKLRWWGYGSKESPLGTEYPKGDLVVSSDGSNVEGDVELRIMDSRGRTEKAYYELGDADTLRELAAEDRSERSPLPALGPHGLPHRKMQVVLYADAASDGETVDPAASTFRCWYSEYDPSQDD